MTFFSFLSTKKERRAWHRGIYKGVWKYWKPQTIFREEYPDDGFLKWEDREKQYEHFTMMVFYIGKWYGIVGVLYFAQKLGVLKEFLALLQVIGLG